MNVNKEEVLRYLGYRNQKIDETIKELLNTCIKEVKKYSNRKYTYVIYDLTKNENIHEIELNNTNLSFKGKDIFSHLKSSSKCAIMAATIGLEVERRTKLYEKTNLTKAVIFDACATTAIESFCDEVENEIKKEAEKIGLDITYRYSPGYGDFNIDIQQEIIKALDCHKKIGLTVTGTNLLIPRKSVTAIIGFQDKNIRRQHPGCGNCNKKDDCLFRKAGNYCGN